MGFFGRKKADVPQEPQTPLTEPEGAFVEVACLVCVSIDARRHSFESDGYVRFYQNEMAIYAPPVRGAARDAMFRPAGDTPILQMCFPYAEISRIFFPRKITARIELQNGRYAFLVFSGNSREVFTDQLSERGIAYEPPKK